MKLVLLNFKCSDSEQIAITIRSNQNIIVERKINHFSIFIITVSYSKYILPLIALLLFMEILFHQPTILFAATNILSEASLVAPYKFIGFAALSVDKAITLETF